MNGLMILMSFFLFTFCDANSIETLMKTDWFFGELNKDATKLGKDFDFVSTYSFLSKAKKTSCFSSICGEINFHLQLIHYEYGKEYVEHSQKILSDLDSRIKSYNDGVNNTANRVFMRQGDAEARSTTSPSGYDFRIYDDNNVDERIDEYKEWINKETDGILKGILNSYDLINNQRCYISTFTFIDLWLSWFKKSFTRPSDFKLSDGTVQRRDFMYQRSHFHYKEVKINKASFKMVLLPYLGIGKDNKGKEDENKFRSNFWRTGKKPTRFMIYLIPDKHDVKLPTLWNNFYDYIKSVGSINKVISSIESREIELYIPKIEKLQSNLDAKDIFGSLFSSNNSEYVESKMNTVITIDEKGTRAAAEMVTLSSDGLSTQPPPCPEVRADRPYLAFIYDSNLERTLFVLNDVGNVKK